MTPSRWAARIGCVLACAVPLACSAIDRVPPDLGEQPAERLLMVSSTTLPDAELVSIDGYELGLFDGPTLLIRPGTHQFTFETSYFSSNYYPAHLVMPELGQGQARSFLLGRHSLTVTGRADEMLVFRRKAEPDFKRGLGDLLEFEILPQPGFRRD